jgi:hypothetical protein
MDDPETLARMRPDWNMRAAKTPTTTSPSAAANGGEEEFFSTAADVVRDLESQLPRLRGEPAALEIGCGPGMSAGNSRGD